MDLSIIIPTHNEILHIRDCLLALKEIDRLDINYEIIVVDSASDDGTVEEAKKFNVNVISLKAKTWPSISRNIGTKNSTGKFLAFIDADIVVSPKWCRAVQGIILNKRSNLRLSCYGNNYGLSKKPGWLEKSWFEPLTRKNISYLSGGNIVIKKALFEDIDGFNESLETGEDVDFCRRARANNIEVKIDTQLFVHHEGNPQTLRAFIKRERWHGRGDFINFKNYLRSKVALTSTLYLCVLLASIIGLLLMRWRIFIASLVGLSVLTLLSSLQKFGLSNSALLNSLIYHAYFTGRMLSFLDILHERLKSTKEQ